MRPKWLPLLVLAVPLAGVVELVAHVVQTSARPTELEWNDARAAVERMLRPGDLVLFAPKWTDQPGRMHFGDAIMTVERVARGDETTFERAIEVSLGGAPAPDVASWGVIDEKRVGPFTIRVRENPAPAKVIDDLFRHVAPDKLSVAHVESTETSCPWTRGKIGATAHLFGPALPADRFQCSGSMVGITILPVLDYAPRRCILASPFGGGPILKLHFNDVAFGRVLYGHHGLFQEMERDLKGAPIHMTLHANGHFLGALVHKDGDGWKRFELPTGEMAGKRGTLDVEVTASSGQSRLYCFEATTR